MYSEMLDYRTAVVVELAKAPAVSDELYGIYKLVLWQHPSRGGEVMIV